MLKKLARYAAPYWPLIVLGVAFSAAEAVFELLIPLVMSDIVDIGIKNGNVDYILQQGGKMIFMAVISLVFGVGAAKVASRAGMWFGASLRKAEYDHIQTFAFSNIEKFSTASLITRLTSDVNSMQMTLMMGMRLFVRAPVMMISALILSLRISVQLSAVFLVSLPLLAVLVTTILVKVGPMFRSLQERTDDLNLVVQEDLTGIRAVKSFVREPFEEEKFSLRNHALRDNALRAFGTVVMNMPLMMLVVYATTIAVMWFGGHMVFAGTMEPGKLIAYFTYIMQIMMSLMMVSM
ncbi:MAG: ABC transporter ATP-binding protein, partial [Oscillibacter sp.]|nr:ABC transporter ATP-binding protein [Oscillibacter sp.]